MYLKVSIPIREVEKIGGRWTYESYNGNPFIFSSWQSRI